MAGSDTTEKLEAMVDGNASSANSSDEERATGMHVAITGSSPATSMDIVYLWERLAAMSSPTSHSTLMNPMHRLRSPRWVCKVDYIGDQPVVCVVGRTRRPA